jgi:hypothetical protein
MTRAELIEKVSRDATRLEKAGVRSSFTFRAVSGLLISCYQTGNNTVFAPDYT